MIQDLHLIELSYQAATDRQNEKLYIPMPQTKQMKFEKKKKGGCLFLKLLKCLQRTKLAVCETKSSSPGIWAGLLVFGGGSLPLKQNLTNNHQINEKNCIRKKQVKKKREETKLMWRGKKSIFKGKIMNLKPEDKGLLFSVSRYSKKM